MKLFLIKEIKHLSTRPKPAELELIAKIWRPYRAIATQVLWHYYVTPPNTELFSRFGSKLVTVWASTITD